MYFSKLRLLSSALMPSSVYYTSTNSLSKSAIEIPKRIQRSPTDILRALAATVDRDPTAPAYKYHDDPYLIPTNNTTKRTYAMAQESGRKAARWIKDKHSLLFKHHEADPPIQVFAPKMTFSETDTDVTMETLEQLIEQSETKDAMIVYNLMQQQNLTIDNEIKQKLLELVCFYNHEEPIADDLYEERSFNEMNETRERSSKMWKNTDLAERLFNEIQPKTERSYAAIIRGLAKYYQADRAYALLQQGIEEGLRFDTTTFNSVINIVHYIKENANQRWDLCKELLQQMNEMCLKPNLATMNALLHCVNTFNNHKMSKETAKSILAEFKYIGIQPSLGTYYYILTIFCRERGPVSNVLHNILNEIEGQTFDIRHPKDTYFFATAMNVCRNHLHNYTLAVKLHNLLMTGRNYDLLGDPYKETVYYRNYFAILSQTASVEEFMKVYNLLVPNVYIPEPGVMEEILKMVEANEAFDLLPILWSDMVIFNHLNRETLLKRIIQIMLHYKYEPTNNAGDNISQNLSELLAKIAADIFDKVHESPSKGSNLSFTGELLGGILTILVRGNNFPKAVEVFTFINRHQNRIPGTAMETSLEEYVKACILNKSPSQALHTLQYAEDNQMDAEPLAKLIKESFTLNEVHLDKLNSIIGK